MRPHRVLFLCFLVALSGLFQGVPAARARTATTAPAVRAWWTSRIDSLVGDLPVGVVISYQGRELYAHKDWVARPPASNEKLLLSMALLSHVSADTTLPLRVLGTARLRGGVLKGDLWLTGRGNPDVGRRDLGALASALAAKGIRKVAGRVMGATGPFARDWFAPGWKSYFPKYYIALPTALTYRGNVDAKGRHVEDPERLAAAALTTQLSRAGVRVSHKAGAGTPHGHLVSLATVRSDPLRGIMRRMDVWSRNFSAEVLGKYLGGKVRGAPGTIAKGAAAIGSFAAAHGAGSVIAHDGSGLSYANRITPDQMVRLLTFADGQPWGQTLRGLLARGGQGTLKGRFKDVKLRAKTGTLDCISALSGWVWLERQQDWAEFSILSSGITKSRSVKIENAIVRLANTYAAVPA